MEATREDYEKLLRDAGFSQLDVQIRPITLRLRDLEPVFGIGWEMCELSSLPADTQHKIRTTTEERAAPFKTEDGYEFPDKVVVGTAINRFAKSGLVAPPPR